MMRGFSPWRCDPGPCPVDDTPHTACTPASVAALKAAAIVVPVSPPAALAGAAAILARLPDPAAVFTTATYKRATHGRQLRGPRPKGRPRARD